MLWKKKSAQRPSSSVLCQIRTEGATAERAKLAAAKPAERESIVTIVLLGGVAMKSVPEGEEQEEDSQCTPVSAPKVAYRTRAHKASVEKKNLVFRVSWRNLYCQC